MDSASAALHSEYERAKENLKGVDEKFIKLYGRDPSDKRPIRRVSRPGATGGNFGSSAGRLFGEASRIINNPNREPVGGPGVGERGARPIRRLSSGLGSRLGSIQQRLGPKRVERNRHDSGDEDDLSPQKPALQSAVIVPELKREDSIAMKTDKKGMARNRRMFGALMGTLQGFQRDSKKEEDREKRRAEVEKRLEEKQLKEQAKLRRDRAALWEERREKQRELRLLEIKMKLVKAFEDWEKTMRNQAHFIKTTGRSRHHIFYKPKVLMPANKKALEATEDYIDGVVRDQKRRLEMEIERMMAPRNKRYRRSSPEQREKEKEKPKDRRGDKDEKSDGSESEEQSESEDANTDSEVEEGELTDTRKAVREKNNAEAMAQEQNTEPDELIAKIKTEKDGTEPEVRVKKEVDVDDNGEPVGGEQQVSNGMAQDDDEVQCGDDSVTDSQQEKDQAATKSVKSEDKQVSDGKRKSSKRASPPQRRARSASSSSRSRSRSRSASKPSRPRPPARKRKPKGKSPPANGSGSGSGSGSDSQSGSSSSGSQTGSSGSDSEPERKKPKSTISK